jgi:hypothetical protein
VIAGALGLHDGRENLAAVEIKGRWFVRMVCRCHWGHSVSVPLASEDAARRCIEACDWVARLRLPGGKRR